MSMQRFALQTPRSLSAAITFSATGHRETASANQAPSAVTLCNRSVARSWARHAHADLGTHLYSELLLLTRFGEPVWPSGKAALGW